MRREKIVNERENLSEDELSYYIEALCRKQQEYRDFVGVFEYDNLEGVQVKALSHSDLVVQYEVVVEGKGIRINLLNSAWLTERKEKPGYLYFPSKEYQKITKDGHIEITVYHHPSNWIASK